MDYNVRLFYISQFDPLVEEEPVITELDGKRKCSVVELFSDC